MSNGIDLPTIGSKWTHASEPGVYVIVDATTDGRVIWTEEGDDKEWVAPLREFIQVFTPLGEPATASSPADVQTTTGLPPTPQDRSKRLPISDELTRTAFDAHLNVVLSTWHQWHGDTLDPIRAALTAVYPAIRQQVAEEIATKASDIAEQFQATAVTHRDLSHEHGNTLKGTSHMATAHAYRNKADGAWAVMHAARDIGGQE